LHHNSNARRESDSLGTMMVVAILWANIRFSAVYQSDVHLGLLCR